MSYSTPASNDVDTTTIPVTIVVLFIVLFLLFSIAEYYRRRTLSRRASRTNPGNRPANPKADAGPAIPLVPLNAPGPGPGPGPAGRAVDPPPPAVVMNHRETQALRERLLALKEKMRVRRAAYELQREREREWERDRDGYEWFGDRKRIWNGDECVNLASCGRSCPVTTPTAPDMGGCQAPRKYYWPNFTDEVAGNENESGHETGDVRGSGFQQKASRRDSSVSDYPLYLHPYVESGIDMNMRKRNRRGGRGDGRWTAAKL
ncbi:hypothetical protein K402DRAFT_417006 [Aulographum hederae CBS 113979]|uniref:Uncharacterized protein n=1 Tax=Aulographum hederae CBS 113979 TaxID=1176131 RepID=A0A6G1HFE1_9PEZI|nr:hypothetical protein K402DRAFT_417006 [Aulographum hederae CBS 113979]